MKIALIGPGLQPIPSEGWGAVENIIWQYKHELQLLRHSVTIINEPDIYSILSKLGGSWGKNFDWVHCMYDDWAGPLADHYYRAFATTTHYGYLEQKHKWSPGYHYIHRGVLRSPGIIALSPSIAQFYKNEDYKGVITYLRNGAEYELIWYKLRPEKDVVCVGKIETRKRQASLVKQIDGDINCDFIGPITDNTFSEGKTCKYLGTWTRKELYENLSNYKVLILLSDGEAAPLVVPEAICAGLSVVVSECAAANLPKDMPGVYRIPEEKLTDTSYVQNTIRQALAENSKFRDTIRHDWGPRFSWKNVVADYDRLIKGMTNA